MDTVSLILHLIVSIIMIMMFVRAVLSYFPDIVTSRFYDLLFVITEPVIMPVRYLFDALNLDDSGFGIDLPFLITAIILTLVKMVLP